MHGSEKHRPTCSAKVFKKGILWQTSKLVPELSEMLPPKSHQSKLSKQGGSKSTPDDKGIFLIYLLQARKILIGSTDVETAAQPPTHIQILNP